MEDTYRHRGLRRQLIDRLREKGVKDETVLQAISAVPRHFFLDKAFEEWAYEDKPFPIGNEQTISQPFTVAYQTTLLQVKKREKVLEIGTGSGYQAAILAVLGARVYTLERQEALFLKTRALFKNLSFGNIRMYYRDGFKGLPEFAPFDKILVTAGASEIPKTLLEQLAIGGLMVIPVGDRKGQWMLRLQKVSEKEYIEERFDRFRFVPFLPGTERSTD